MLAVHTDKSHTHCHIIFNNTNLYNGLSFTTEHNQGRKNERAWAELRQVSDEICAEHGLSVIAEPEKGHSVSHFERDMQKEGKSWKDKLRAKIAEVAFYSKSFEEFLQKCTDIGIEYVYKPQNKVKLKFRLTGEGQQKFTRADTLGEDYTAERIAEQIEQIQKAQTLMETLAKKKKPEKTVATPTPPKPAEPTQSRRIVTEELLARVREQRASKEQTSYPTATPPIPKPDSDRVVITAEEFLAPLYDKPATPLPTPKPTEVKAPEKKIDEWASIRGMRDSDKIIAELESVGITSYTDFTGFMYRGQHDDDHTDEVAELKAHINNVETIIAKMKHHDELVPTYREYKGLSGLKQSRYKKKHSEQIEDFEQTRAYIKEHCREYTTDEKLPSLQDMEKLLKRMKDRRDEILPEHKAFLAKKQVAKQYTQVVRRYRDQQINKRAAEQSRQKKLSQQRNKNTLE